MPLSLSATDGDGAVVEGSALPGLAPAEGSQHPLSIQETSRISWCSCIGVKPPKWFPIDFRLQEAGRGRGWRGEQSSEIWVLWAFFQVPLPGTAQTFCAGSDGSLKPRVHLQRVVHVLTSHPPLCSFCPLHCHIKIPGIPSWNITVQWQYYQCMGGCFTPVSLVRIH